MSCAEDKVDIKVWVLSKDNLSVWPDDKERTMELCIIFDKRYIRGIPCLLVWHGKTRSFPGMGNSHADGY